MKTILVVDDDTAHGAMLQALLSDWGYAVELADDGTTGVEKVEARPYDMVLTDMKMVNMSGMEALQRIKAFNPAIPVVIMTAYSSVQTAVKALKIGATDYLIKPLDFDKLRLTIDRLFENIALKSENSDLKNRLREKVLSHDIIGESPRMKTLLDTIAMVAPTEASVLVTGESGTGKELVSSAIHFNSARRDKPFVRINCAAISPSLLESELFGHEKGAFTGADRKRKGKFLKADRGTILLDEIGEMDLSMQAKLLRVIQEREITPVGSDADMAVDVRVIASTNRDLKAMAKNADFREDLYYRLNVVSVAVPPLRERKTDIPALAQYFLGVYCEKNRRDISGFTPRALDAMIRYGWPGNVRELSNCIERAVVLARTDKIDSADLAFLPEEAFTDPASDLSNIPLETVEQKAICATLDAAGGNKSEAARRLGITRKTLLKKLKTYKGNES